MQDNSLLSLNLYCTKTETWGDALVIMEQHFESLKDLIVFISGVPGVGKTTVSYELLKRFSVFRIIEETDLMRDALRGYRELLCEKAGVELNSLLDEFEVFSSKKLLTLSDAENQCRIMRKSIENIVDRQQRKRIPSIVNGVHIVPHVLSNLASRPHLVFINLYVNNCAALFHRLQGRKSRNDMLQQVSLLFKTNQDLFSRTAQLAATSNRFYNIDVTMLNIDATIDAVILCVENSLKDNL